MDIEINSYVNKKHSGTFNIYHNCLANQDCNKFIIGNGNILIYITTEFNKYVIFNYPKTDDAANMNMLSHININDTHIIIAILKPTLSIYTLAIQDINSMITQSDPENPLLNCTNCITWQNITLPDYVQQYLTTNTDDLLVGIVKGIGNTFLCVINNYVLSFNPITNTFWNISYNAANAISNMTINPSTDHIIVQFAKNEKTYIAKPTTIDIDFECKIINIDNDMKTFTFLSKYNFIAGIKDNKCYIAFLETIVNKPDLDFNSKWHQTIIPFEDPDREFIIDIQIYNRILVVQTYKNIYAAIAITPTGIPINPAKLIWQKVTVKPSTLKLYQTAIEFNINIITDDHLEEYDTNITTLWSSLLTPVHKKFSDTHNNILAITMNGNIYQIIYTENDTFEAEHIFMSEMKPIQDRHLDYIVSQYIFLDKYVITVPNNDEILSPQEILSKKIIDNAMAKLTESLKQHEQHDTIADDKSINANDANYIESVSQE